MNKELRIMNNTRNHSSTHLRDTIALDSIHHSSFIIHHSRKGFTLIELLVVIGITVMLSSALISYNHTSRQQLSLYAEEAKLTQMIFRAKSLALGSYVQSSNPNVCGYGVHVDYAAMNYTLFSYGAGISNCQKISSVDVSLENKISTFNLGNNVKLVGSLQGVIRLDDILFVSPDPLVLLNSGGIIVKNGSAAGTIQTQDGSLSTSVKVNSA